MRLYFLFFILIINQLHFLETHAQQLESPEIQVQYADTAIITSLRRQLTETSYLLKSLDQELIMKQEKVKQDKLSWLSSFRIGLQFFSLDQGVEAADPTRIGILPSLGASLQLDLQGLATLGSKVRSAKADLTRMEHERDRQEQILALWIQEKYLDYVGALESLKLQLQVLQSLQEKAALVQRQFESGEGKLEDFLLIENAIAQTRESILKTKISAEKIYLEIQTSIKPVAD